MEAQYYSVLEGGKVHCRLCPHSCKLGEGMAGICRIRRNIGGKLIAEGYETYSAISFDPIEKKPLYHFYPGTEILSVGGLGCNMRCKWCQNCEISQSGVETRVNKKQMTARQLLQLAGSRNKNIGIAYTYNEPTIAFESNIQVARLFRKEGYKNVLVSNGYLSEIPLNEYLKYIDAVNLDIKAFNPITHLQFTGARLEPVLKNAVKIFKAGIHLELTYLVVSSVNDDETEFRDFIKWMVKELGNETPLHISRYFPRHEFNVEATNPATLKSFVKIAQEYLDYIYLGNYISQEYEHTICAECKELIIEREGYHVRVSPLSGDGNCNNCGQKVFVAD